MRRHWTWVCCVALLLAPRGDATAQIIPVKTVPVAEGDQFTFLPSANRGMAGVSIALADSILDPFVNPARGGRLSRGYFFGSPSFYSLSRKGGGGSTLPVGMFARRGGTFAGGALAVQELSPAGESGGEVLALSAASLVPGTATPQSHTNRYAFAAIGHSLASSRLSFGGSVMWSRLRGVDGVDLLYPGAHSVDQLGDVVNLRAGLVKEWAGARSLEAVVIHQRHATAHDINYLDFFWDPATRQPVVNVRDDHNYDRTHVWGVQLQYQRPIADSAWRMGATVTGNRTTQLTVPLLGVMNPTHDPGESAAYNIGLGVARSLNQTVAAVDAIYEPIWSHARNASAGDRYRFSNAIVRSGVSRDFKVANPAGVFQLQFGMQARLIRYVHEELDQAQQPRRTRQGWNEWTHTWATSFRMAEFQVHYQWRLTSGVERLGMPDVVFFGNRLVTNDSFFPQAPQLAMLPVRVTTQQLSISVPIR